MSSVLLRAWALGLALLLPSAARGEGEQPGAGEYETVVRSSAVDELRPRDDPAAFATTLRLKEPSAGTGLAELLERVPGLRIKDSGPGGRRSLSIRGAESHQVQVLLDGVRLSSAAGGGVDLTLLDPGHLELVEVRRGGASARFGSAALGGVLSLSTPRLRTRARTRAAAAYGPWNTLALRASRSASLARRIRYLVSASYRRSDGDFPYRDSYGREALRRNNDSNLGEGLVKLDYLLSERWQVGLTNSFSAAARGAPGMAETPSESGRQRDLRNLTSLRLTRYDAWLAGSRLVLNLYHRYTFFRFDQQDEQVIPESHSVNHCFNAGGSAKLELPLGRTGRLDGGLELRGTVFRDPATDDPSRLDLDLWASNQTRLLRDHLTVVPAVRLAVASGFGAAVAPRLGVVIHPLRWSERPWLAALALAANVGRSYRYPSFQELYIRLDGFGGNADLEPEDALEADVGLRWRHGPASLEAALFSRWIDNTILFAPVSSFLVRADNYPRARARGVEASADLRPGVGLRLQGSYTFTETRFGEPAMSLPGHPPHRVAVRLGWRYPFKDRRRWGLGLWTGATVESGQVLSRFDSTEEEGRVLLSAGASFTWRWLTLSAEGRNLLDKRDALDTVGFPIAPARFMVSAALSL